jgi:methylated-DNA-[protein]-cysteine S-methyltransferase
MYTLRSPVGPVSISASQTSVQEIFFGTKKGGPTNRLELACARQLAEYLKGSRKKFVLPLLPHGTDFQKRVWSTLLKVPHGQTVTYAELARMAGTPSATRAVANALGKNPIPIVIPCHRVLSSAGIGGFSGGLWRKRTLLKLESAAFSLASLTGGAVPWKKKRINKTNNPAKALARVPSK